MRAPHPRPLSPRGEGGAIIRARFPGEEGRANGVYPDNGRVAATVTRVNAAGGARGGAEAGFREAPLRAAGAGAPCKARRGPQTPLEADPPAFPRTAPALSKLLPVNDRSCA